MRIRLMRFMDYMFLFTYIAFELDFGIIKYVFALLFVAVFLTMEYIQGYPLSINDATGCRHAKDQPRYLQRQMCGSC